MIKQRQILFIYKRFNFEHWDNWLAPIRFVYGRTHVLALSLTKQQPLFSHFPRKALKAIVSLPFISFRPSSTWRRREVSSGEMKNICRISRGRKNTQREIKRKVNMKNAWGHTFFPILAWIEAVSSSLSMKMPLLCLRVYISGMKIQFQFSLMFRARSPFLAG